MSKENVDLPGMHADFSRAIGCDREIPPFAIASQSDHNRSVVRILDADLIQPVQLIVIRRPVGFIVDMLALRGLERAIVSVLDINSPYQRRGGCRMVSLQKTQIALVPSVVSRQETTIRTQEDCPFGLSVETSINAHGAVGGPQGRMELSQLQPESAQLEKCVHVLRI
jgi:hypothetical protein